jgi:hypothetical protein
MSRPDFKDIVHSQAQWEVIEQKLKERDEFEKAKSIIVIVTKYISIERTEYSCLSSEQEAKLIAELGNKVENQNKEIDHCLKMISDLGEHIQAKNKTIEEKDAKLILLENIFNEFKQGLKELHPKRKWGFLWKIK